MNNMPGLLDTPLMALKISANKREGKGVMAQNGGVGSFMVSERSLWPFPPYLDIVRFLIRYIGFVVITRVHNVDVIPRFQEVCQVINLITG